jgi:membrane protein
VSSSARVLVARAAVFSPLKPIYHGRRCVNLAGSQILSFALRARRQLRNAFAFVVQVWHRFLEDRCLTVAASLSYMTLLALVPLTALSFAMLAAFPVFDDARQQLQHFVFAYFVPDAIETVQEYLAAFAERARGVTAIGVVGLTVTAMLLFNTIESALNDIFRVTRSRPLISKFIVFWAILTLGPLLLGASVSLDATLAPPQEILQSERYTSAAAYLAQALPTLLSILAFMLFYVMIPYRPVRLANALVGATVAGILFSVLRYSFTLYVTLFPAYETLYGALALIPMFLLWTYLSWAVILAGAVMTAELPAWGIGEIGGGDAQSPGARLVLALAILAHLYQVSQHGGGANLSQILKKLPARDRGVEDMLNQLRRADYVDITKRDRWLPARDLHATTVHDLYADLRLNMRPDIALAGHVADPWQERLNAILNADLERKREVMSITLSELFSGKPEEQKAGLAPLSLRRAP